jgi:hypothetical protein
MFSHNDLFLKIWGPSPMDMAKGSIRTFPKWKKFRRKWSPNILADYCRSFVKKNLAK